MILKLIGLGFKGYVSDKLNIFDAFIVIISVVETILSFFPEISFEGLPFDMTLFRALRLFRLFKLLRSLGNLRSLLNALWKTIKDTGNIMFLICMFIAISSLLGLEFMSHRVWVDPEGQVANFKDFLKLSVEEKMQ